MPVPISDAISIWSVLELRGGNALSSVLTGRLNQTRTLLKLWRWLTLVYRDYLQSLLCESQVRRPLGRGERDEQLIALVQGSAVRDRHGGPIA